MATTRIPRDFKEFLKLLDAHSARFLLIGGYAVNAFDYVRNTVDMDNSSINCCFNSRVPLICLREAACRRLASSGVKPNSRKRFVPDFVT